MRITTLDTALHRIELPVPLSDSTHGTMTHFELVTVRLRDSDGAEGVGYTYTTGAGGAAVHVLIDQDLRAVLLLGAHRLGQHNNFGGIRLRRASELRLRSTPIWRRCGTHPHRRVAAKSKGLRLQSSI